MIKELALRWPVLRQILQGGDGTGPEAMSHRTQTLRPKNEGAKVARSVCPYCAVPSTPRVEWALKNPIR